MSKLIQDSELNAEIERLFLWAKNELIIISPFIRLHPRLKEVLNLKKDDDLCLTVVYGKNKDNKEKSLSREDLAFFKEFRDVEISYEERLHAKVYANDQTSILTSMNLYDFSMNNNIEFGVINHKKSFLQRKIDSAFSDSLSLDDQVTFFMLRIIQNSEVLFRKTAKYQDRIFSSKYVGSEIELDKTIDTTITRRTTDNQQMGYCIRTGVPILFNPKKPFSAEAYKAWGVYKNPDYKEQYCHKTGVKSHGRTSFNNPILH